jgi:uncharacterized protein (DUF1800 family)
MAISKVEALAGLNRLGLGLRPGDSARLAADPRGAVEAEITQAAPTIPLADSTSVARDIFAYIAEEQRRRSLAPPQRPANLAVPPDGGGMMLDMAPQANLMPGTPPAQPGAGMAPSVQVQSPPLPQRLYLAEAEARFAEARAAAIGFRERLVWFWANHFAVAISKGIIVRGLAGAYERDVVRPHVFGRFADMLLASAKHPAMLFYLDNQLSIGPGSRAGRRRGRGLNENLAREILELHTLGVDGGYTQADVTSLARIITGWTFVGPRARPELGTPGRFHFEPNFHEPGAFSLLGRSYAADGMRQGERALADLARHPATARQVATKLARHFIADQPPADSIARLADAFVRTEGDLAAVSRALIAEPGVWSTGRHKLRSPAEFLAASLRATGVPVRPPGLLAALAIMGQPLWNPTGPNGFPDVSSHWLNPKGLASRLDVAARVARGVAKVVDPRALADDVLGPTLTDETLTAIRRAESRQEALALLLMSPEFQRR